MSVTINPNQRLYVIPSGDGYTCLGFDVAEARRKSYLGWLMKPVEPVTIGTIPAYEAYLTALSEVMAFCLKNNKRCPAELTPELIGLEGKRVEVTTPTGEVSRFYVGKSTGPIPIHLEIKQRNSSGGPGVYMPPGSKVRVIGER